MAGRAHVVVYYDDGSLSSWDIPDDDEHMGAVTITLFEQADSYKVKDRTGHEIPVLGKYGI